MDEWNIQGRNIACSACARPFENKESFHTVLGRIPTGFQRLDFCPSCWNGSGGNMVREKAGVVSFWQSIFEPPAPPPPDPLPKEDAESILRQMMERNDSSEMEARYILAVMLERKRILKHRETRQNDPPLLIYEHVRTGEVFLITDPKLRLDQIMDVQRKVASLLKEPQSPTAPSGGTAIAPTAEAAAPESAPPPSP